MKVVEFSPVQRSYSEIKDRIDREVFSLLEVGPYVGGKAVETFEKKWAAYCGANYAVGVANGLDALTLALKALDVGAGDEVIVPSNTYIATWLAVSNCGATIVPVEPNINTHNIDAFKIEKKITKKTKVIMPVHLYGAPAQINEIIELAKKYNISVVEDAAQAHGASVDGKKIGCHGDAVCWSFYPTKNLGAFGDAGAVTTNKEKLAQKIKILGNYGSAERYKNEVIGCNSRLDPIQASILSVKLEYLDLWNERRIENALFYEKEFALLPINMPKHKPNIGNVFHQFVVETERRDELMTYLKKFNIQTLVHYPIPPFKQKAYASSFFEDEQLPIATSMSGRILSLPAGPHISTDERKYVADALQSFFGV